MQQDPVRVRRVLAFGFGVLIVSAAGAVLTFVVGLRVLGASLALLAIFNLVNVTVILVQMRQRHDTTR